MPNKTQPTLSNTIREEAERILLKLFSVRVQPCEPFAESFDRGTVLVELTEAILSALNHTKVEIHVKDCYQEALFALQDKFLYINKVSNLSALEKEYDKLTENLFKNHPSLSDKERQPIYEIISYYRALFRQCFVLHQLANLGGDLNTLYKMNDVLASENSANSNYPNQCLGAKEDLKNALKTLNAEFDPMNAQVHQYEKSLKRSIEHYKDEETYNLANFQEPFLNLKNELIDFQNRLNKFKLNLSDKNTFVRLPPDIDSSIKKLRDELQLIAKVNILNCSDLLKDPDNFPKRIADLSAILQKYKNAYSEKEAALNDEAQQLLDEYNKLKTELMRLNDDVFVKLRVYQAELKNQSVIKVLPTVPRAELDLTDTVVQVKTARDQVNAAFTYLKKIKVNLLLQQSNVELFIRKLRLEGKGKLIDLLNHLNESKFLEKNNTVIEQATAVLKGKLSKESAWAKVVSIIERSKKEFSTDILALQKACQLPNKAEDEVAALEKNLAGRIRELSFKQNEIMKSIDPYVELLQTHDEKIFELREQVNRQLEGLYNREIKSFTDIQLNMNANCEQLASEIKNFKFEADIPKTNIKLDYPEEARQVEKQLLQLKEIYAGQLRKLHKAEGVVNKHEVDAICDRSKTQKPNQSTNFFSRHWGKIVGLTSAGAVLGAGAGLTLGLLSAAPTLGFGTIAFTALGFCIGAFIGGVTGILGAVISECIKNKKDTLEPSAPTVAQELEPPIRPAPAISIAPRNICSNTSAAVLKDFKEITPPSDELSFRRSYN